MLEVRLFFFFFFLGGGGGTICSLLSLTVISHYKDIILFIPYDVCKCEIPPLKYQNEEIDKEIMNGIVSSSYLIHRNVYLFHTILSIMFTKY